jgi:hypothetical protein
MVVYLDFVRKITMQNLFFGIAHYFCLNFYIEERVGMDFVLCCRLMKTW